MRCGVLADALLGFLVDDAQPKLPRMPMTFTADVTRPTRIVGPGDLACGHPMHAPWRRTLVVFEARRPAAVATMDALARTVSRTCRFAVPWIRVAAMFRSSAAEGISEHRGFEAPSFQCRSLCVADPPIPPFPWIWCIRTTRQRDDAVKSGASRRKSGLSSGS